MSRITLRVGLSRSSHLPISSLGHRPLTYLNPPPFSSSVGERKIMNHFVVLKSFVEWRIPDNRPPEKFAQAARTLNHSSPKPRRKKKLR